MDDQPRPDRGRLLIAAACLLMASLIAGAQSGIIPSGEGAFFAPPQVITALWVGMLLAGALFLLPERSPSALKAGLAFLVLCLVAVVCNWSAFAPDVTAEREQQRDRFFAPLFFQDHGQGENSPSQG